MIASKRHLVTLIGILLALAAYGVYSQHAAAPHTGSEARGSSVPLYLLFLVAEWALVRYVAVGLRKAGTPFRELMGTRWTGWKDILRDVSIAMGVWVAWTLGAGAVDRLLGGDQAAKELTNLLPRGPAEIAVWVALSLTAGFCEEVVYRGYLQRQLEALSGRPAVAVLGQAVIFGISHGYQGVRNVIFITIYGVLFGALARWRRSLKPGMILHAWTDVFGGIFEKSF